MAKQTISDPGPEGPNFTIKEGAVLTVASGNEYVIAEGTGSKEGKSGTVATAYQRSNGDKVAVKFFLPTHIVENLEAMQREGYQNAALPGVEALIQSYAGKDQGKEIESLRRIHHPNIVKFVDYGSYTPPVGALQKPYKTMTEVPFVVMQHVEGSHFSDWFSTCKSQDEALDVLYQLCDSLSYLHEDKNYLHSDIKSQNILVSDLGALTLIDFALYQNLNWTEVEKDEHTTLHAPWTLLPNWLKPSDRLFMLKVSGGTRAEIREVGLPAIDAFQLGNLLEGTFPSFEKIFEDSIDFIRNLIAKLRLSQRQEFPVRAFRSELEKIDRRINPSHLDSTKTLTFPEITIELSKCAERVINCKAFARLKFVRQLGLVSEVYPGAQHTRAFHSLVTYQLTNELIRSLHRRSDHVFLRYYTNEFARTTSIAALVHDLMHFQFLHVFEEADLLESDFEQQVTKNLIDGVRETARGDTIFEKQALSSILAEEKVSSKDVLAILFWPRCKPQNLTEEQVVLAHSMLDSGSDVDKMAYLFFDSYFTGIPYGRAIDRAAIFRSATVTISSGRPVLAFHESGLPALETMAFARYANFQTIYWNHTHRALMSMLLRVAQKAFVGSKRRASFRRFLADSLFDSQEQFLSRLDDVYRRKTGTKRSIITDIQLEHENIYKRLIVLRPNPEDSDEEVLARRIVNMGRVDQLRLVESAGPEILKILNPTIEDDSSFSDDESFLLDVPGRRIDNPGVTKIVLENLEVSSLAQVSQPVKRLVSNFEILSKRVRIYVHPRHMKGHTRQDIIDIRPAIVSILERAVERLSSEDQKRS